MRARVITRDPNYIGIRAVGRLLDSRFASEHFNRLTQESGHVINGFAIDATNHIATAVASNQFGLIRTSITQLKDLTFKAEKKGTANTYFLSWGHNNKEWHGPLKEYIGSYLSDIDGQTNLAIIPKVRKGQRHKALYAHLLNSTVNESDATILLTTNFGIAKDPITQAFQSAWQLVHQMNATLRRVVFTDEPTDQNANHLFTVSIGRDL